MKHSMAIGFILAAVWLALMPAWSEGDEGASASAPVPAAAPAPASPAKVVAIVKPAAPDDLLKSLEPAPGEAAAAEPQTGPSAQTPTSAPTSPNPQPLRQADAADIGSVAGGLGSTAMEARMSHPLLPADLDAPIVAPKTANPGEPGAGGAAQGNGPAINLAALPAPPPEPFRINEASADELARILGLDARRARILAAYRKVHGPFREPEDVAQVQGITDEQTLAWEAAGLLHFD